MDEFKGFFKKGMLAAVWDMSVVVVPKEIKLSKPMGFPSCRYLEFIDAQGRVLKVWIDIVDAKEKLKKAIDNANG